MNTQARISAVSVLTNLQLPIVRCRVAKVRNEGATKFRRVPGERWREFQHTNRAPESFHDCNVAIQTGHKLPDGRYLYIVDVDLKKEEGKKEFGKLIAEYGAEWTNAPCTQTESGGKHFWFACEKSYSVQLSLFPAIDFLGLGTISFEPPSQFLEDGLERDPYKWISQPPSCAADIPNLPRFIIDHLEVREIKNNIFKQAKEKNDAECASGVSEEQLQFIEACFERYTPENGLEYDHWLRCAMALHEGSDGSEVALDIFDAWGSRVAAEKGGEYDEKKTRITWDSFGVKGSRVTYATLVKYFSQDKVVMEFINDQILEINKLFTSVTPEGTGSEVTSASSSEVTKKDGSVEYLYTEAFSNAVITALGEPTIRTNETNGAIEITMKGSEVTRKLDTPMESEILFACRDYARKHKIKPLAKGEDVIRIVGMVAEKNKYHPIRDYLDDCLGEYKRVQGLDNTQGFILAKMSGTQYDPKRIYRERMYAGINLKQNTESQKKDYIWFRKAMDHFLRGMICKVFWQFQNQMLCLQGNQGVGKSTLAKGLVKNIGFPYFHEGAIDPDNKDHRIKMAQILLWEPAELAGTLSSADVNKLKALLTMGQVSERPPYGRYNVDMPVCASFLGTVNNPKFLLDDTGNRRFIVARFDPVDHMATINYLRGPEFNPNMVFGEVYNELLETGIKVPAFNEEDYEEAMARSEAVRSQSDLEIWLEDNVEVQPISEKVTEEWRMLRNDLRARLNEDNMRMTRNTLQHAGEILSRMIGFSFSDGILKQGKDDRSGHYRFFRRCRLVRRDFAAPSMPVKKSEPDIDLSNFF
jgi:hypothetical protein